MDAVGLILTAVALVIAGSDTASSARHYIHWNSSNPIFRIDNTDHIIDVNKGNGLREYDQANIICPTYGAGEAPTYEHERYIIYSVSKEEYDMCRVMSANPKVVAVCDKPTRVLYFTLTFRDFTPTPGSMEFNPGQDYYFISTSADGDLHRRVGGKCSSHNMRLVFKVAPRPGDQEPDDRSAAADTPYRDDDVQRRREEPLLRYPPGEVAPDVYQPLDSNDINSGAPVKQEASRMQHSSASSSPKPTSSVLVIVACLSFFVLIANEPFLRQPA